MARFTQLWGSAVKRTQVHCIQILSTLFTCLHVGFGRLCSKKKAYYAFSSAHIFLEIIPKLCYFLKIILSVTEIMLLRFYIDFKENKDHQQLNSINFDFDEPSYSPPSSLTVFSIANRHVRTSKSQMIIVYCLLFCLPKIIQIK